MRGARKVLCSQNVISLTRPYLELVHLPGICTAISALTDKSSIIPLIKQLESTSDARCLLYHCTGARNVG